MKRTLFISIILLQTMILSAQNLELPSNVTEVKFNLGYAILGIIEFDVERTLHSNYTFGLALAKGFKRDSEYVAAFNPFIRLYPLRINGSSIFIEGFYALYRRDGGSVIPDYNHSFFGASLGYKHLFSYGLSFEVIAGLGLPVNDNALGTSFEINMFPRFGLFIGKRF